MARKGLLFARECPATVLRPRGERSISRNDHRTSSGTDRAALAWGAYLERLRTRLLLGPLTLDRRDDHGALEPFRAAASPSPEMSR